MSKDFLKKILTSEIFKNVSILVSGTVLAQLIPILLQFLLRRIYPPEVFGAFSVYLSIVNISLFFFTFRYELSIVNPKKDIEAVNLVSLIWILAFFSSIIYLILIIFFKNQVIIFLHFPKEFSYWLYFLPLTLFVRAVYTSLQYWLIRKKAFKGLSFNKIIRRSTEGVAQSFFGFFKINFGLVLGDFFGMVSNLLSGFYQSFKSGFAFKDINFKTIKFVAKKFKEYPLFNLFPALGNTAGLMLPVIFFNKLFGAELTANFDLTRQILAVPLSFLSISISQVYLQRWSEKYNNKQSVKKDILTLILFLGSLSFLLIITFYFFGEWLIPFLYGKKYVLSGQYSTLLIFKYALVFIVSPMSIIFIAFKKIKIVSFWQITYFLAILALGFIKEVSDFQFLKIYVFIDLFAYSFYFLLIALLVFNYEKNLKNENSNH